MEQLQLKMWSTGSKIRGSDFPANYPAQESMSTVAKLSFVQSLCAWTLPTLSYKTSGLVLEEHATLASI